MSPCSLRETVAWTLAVDEAGLLAIVARVVWVADRVEIAWVILAMFSAMVAIIDWRSETVVSSSCLVGLGADMLVGEYRVPDLVGLIH